MGSGCSTSWVAQSHSHQLPQQRVNWGKIVHNNSKCVAHEPINNQVQLRTLVVTLNILEDILVTRVTLPEVDLLVGVNARHHEK